MRVRTIRGPGCIRCEHSLPAELRSTPRGTTVLEAPSGRQGSVSHAIAVKAPSEGDWALDTAGSCCQRVAGLLTARGPLAPARRRPHPARGPPDPGRRQPGELPANVGCPHCRPSAARSADGAGFTTPAAKKLLVGRAARYAPRTARNNFKPASMRLVAADTAPIDMEVVIRILDV